MAALRPDQAKTDAAAMTGMPGTQVTPPARRYEIGRGMAGRYLDMTIKVRCVRT